ncbi:MAG TPA: phosphatase PAP2 family protein [Flavisolibacter sp.]|jgi:membrane-associated phospholipid phosphatase|nr:phosphatase PAP2 family protein [Flavisolibacter sp.]
MKKAFLSSLLLLAATAAWSQTSKKTFAVNHEAAQWKTVLLENTAVIVTPPPPSPARTREELQAVRKALGSADEKKRSAIRYWNAGAPAYRWNQVAPKLISWNKPDVVLRTPSAWMNAAIYNATVLAWKEKEKHKRPRPHQADPSLVPLVSAPQTYSYPCEHSVTAAAAATVLAYFYPEKADSILGLAKMASQSRLDAGVQFPSDVEAGWQLGEQVAQQIIEKAKADGSANKWDGTMNRDPKKWTGPYPLGITAKDWSPMILRTANQFRPPAPPDFEKEMKELKEFKQTPKTTYQALYWANTGELWTEQANQKLFEYRMMDDAPTAARVYAVLTSAYHDMAIAIMDAKYAYWGIRPAQYDSTFKPLIATPPFPGYPSGHAAGAATSSAILSYFFPADAQQFQQLAQDCADSRFYAGIHFRTDNETGLKMGYELGKFIVSEWLKD